MFLTGMLNKHCSKTPQCLPLSGGKDSRAYTCQFIHTVSLNVFLIKYTFTAKVKLNKQ